MDTLAGSSLRAHFAALPDPRVDRTKRHQLLDIVTIAICAVLCGADTWVDVEGWGKAKLGWLRAWLDLPHGVPSHDTFGRVFAALDPAAFEACFLAWVRDLATTAPGDVVAIDGKTARRSHDRAHGEASLHLVSAWATANHLVLGQVAVADHSNEIEAIPALLDALALQGAIVTIDAMGCQTTIARRVQSQGADYVLALKDNQPTLHELVAHHFTLTAGDAVELEAPHHRTLSKAHGRLEVRRCWATDAPDVLEWLDPERGWPALSSVACVEGERRIGETVTRERRYYLTSLPADAARIAAEVRGHWGIENQLHWVLDIAFREDECRVRSGHAATNLAVVRHIALNLLRQEPTAKVGIKAKRLRCGWDDAYLLKVLLA